MSWSDIYEQKLRERAKLTQLFETDLEARVVAKRICEMDVKYFVNNFAWTFDPRPDKKIHDLPLILYPIQESYLDWRTACYEGCEDGLTEKSRDMGITWNYLAWDLHRWLFGEGFHALLGSRKEDLVYKMDNPDALFTKLKYITDKLPSWLLPKGFDPSKHYSHLILKNPANGNTIVGESANPEFSRQGRYSVIDLDEFAFWPFAGASWTAAGDATRCRFPVSTPFGKNNKFADLKFNSNIKQFRAHWTAHPEKDETWAKIQRDRKTPKEWAQEQDIDYEVSGGELWLPWYNKYQPEIENDAPIKADAGWLVYGSVDNHPRNPSSVHFYAVDYDGNYYVLNEFYSPASIETISKWMKKQDEFGRCEWISGDPQLWAEDQEIKDGAIVSRAFLFNQYGIRLIPGTKGQDLAARERTQDLILSNKLKISPRCPKMRWEFSEALRWDDYSDRLGERKNIKETLADKDNHAWDDWKYFVMRNPRAPRRPLPPVPDAGMEGRVARRLVELGEKKGADEG